MIRRPGLRRGGGTASPRAAHRVAPVLVLVLVLAFAFSAVAVAGGAVAAETLPYRRTLPAFATASPSSRRRTNAARASFGASSSAPPLSVSPPSATSTSTLSSSSSGEENGPIHLRRPLVYPLLQVMFDVDDTLKSSGGLEVAGVALGGIDVQYARGEFYPGVFQFAWELSNYSVERNNNSNSDNNRGGNTLRETEGNGGGTTTTGGGPILAPPNVAVLTARAEEFKAALEIKAGSKLWEAFRTTGVTASGGKIDDWGVGPVLYGSVSEWIIQYKKGLRKFCNFERLLEQDPTGRVMQYIYVGDTGELDQEAGETMLREYPEVVRAVFLHVVYDAPVDALNLSLPPPKLINGRPLIFFRTYVGAAAKATQLGLMSGDGLMRVVDAAKDALDGAGAGKDDGRRVDLERDVEEAYRTLGLVYMR